MDGIEVIVVGVLLAVWVLAIAPAVLEPVVEGQIQPRPGRPEDESAG